jgi:hypothetical protein
VTLKLRARWNISSGRKIFQTFKNLSKLFPKVVDTNHQTLTATPPGHFPTPVLPFLPISTNGRQSNHKQPMAQAHTTEDFLQ